MAGPHITLIRAPILSDPVTGMRRTIMCGISAILITGKILSKGIPIGGDIGPVGIMTRNFIISTIAARVEVGIKDSKAAVPRQPLLVLASVLPEPMPLASVTPEPRVVPAYKPPESPAAAFVTPELQVPSVLARGRLLPAFTAREPMAQPFVTREPRVALAYKPPGPRVAVLAM